MKNKLMLGLWRYIINVPPFLWQKQIAQGKRKFEKEHGTLSEEKRLIHHFVVKELPCNGKPLSPELISDKADPSTDGKPLELFNPHSKLLFIKKSLQILSDYQLIGISYVQDYLLAQYRRNRSINTIRANFGSIYLFLKFIKTLGRNRFKEINCDDLSAYIEYEQDQGKKPTTVHTRLRSLKAFFNFHIDRENIDPAILKRKLRIKIPQRLPRAIDPEDVRRLLSVIKKARDRALILTLLRTGMRIGELLSTQVNEINLSEKRIEIYQAHKNLTGRIVYLSADAQAALKQWMKKRITDTQHLFYGQKGAAMLRSCSGHVQQISDAI